MADLALPFAVRIQCAFLGWSSNLHEPLVGWTRKNHQATLAQDRQAMSEIAREFEGFIDEILRIHGPLVANRRIATRPVEIGGRKIDAGERISLIWLAANRDGRVLEDPDSFSLGRDPADNLLYGAGIHVCPGALLARTEMRIVMEELLERTASIEPVAGKSPTHAMYPASGLATLPLRIRQAL